MRTVQGYCHYAFDWVRVSATGEVSMCCWQQIHTLGNIFEKSFHDIWYSPVAKSIRISIRHGQMHPLCATRSCQWLYKERIPIAIDFPKYPSTIEIYLPNTMCNERCLMCPRSDSNFQPEEDRTKEIVEKLAFLFPYLKRIQFLGLAEPFYKGIVFDALDLIGWKEKYKDNTMLTLFTNGTLFNKPMREKLFSMVPNGWITFSIDAATRETYHLVRSLDAFDWVLNNLYGYAAERGKDNHLAINNNISMLNVHEIEGMVEIAAKACVDFVSFSVTDPDSDKIAAHVLNEQNAQIFKKAHEKTVALAAKLGVKVKFAQPLDKNLAKPRKEKLVNFQISPKLLEQAKRREIKATDSGGIYDLN